MSDVPMDIQCPHCFGKGRIYNLGEWAPSVLCGGCWGFKVVPNPEYKGGRIISARSRFTDAIEVQIEVGLNSQQVYLLRHAIEELTRAINEKGPR